jgi:hypothetical protein
MLLASQGEVPASLVRELLAWIGLRPSPSETERLVAGRVPPFDYLALPVTLQIDPSQAGGVFRTPQGDMVAFHFQLVIPAGNFNGVGRIMGAGGQMPNPAEGMLPMIDARFVVPRRRVAQRVLDEVLPRVLLQGGEG